MSRQQQQQQQLIEGLDAYLQRIGKDLPVGSKVRLRLVQGPLPVSSIDPVETTTSSSSSLTKNNSNTSSIATAIASIPKQSFPSVLKFPPSSTQPPNFTRAPWHTGHGRLHIENVPKPQEDSDEEDNNLNNKPSKTGGGNSDLVNGGVEGGMNLSSATANSNVSSTKPGAGKKRWKYNRNVTPVKQWVVQDQVEFLETMVYRRKQLKYQKLLTQYRKRRMSHPHESTPPPPMAPVPPPIRSTRYVGTPERMTSHHVLFTLQQPKPQQHQDVDDYDDNDDEDRNTATITVRTLPSMEQPIMVPMTQPAVRSHSAFATLSNAAQVMEDQRFAMSSTAASMAFRNARPNLGNNNDSNSNNNNASDTTSLRVGGIRKINKTQSRLLQKLQQKEKTNKHGAEEEDGDDVMADVAYKERKGSSGGARRELLSTLGDGLKVSDDGVVLGGTNDALFGGRGLKFNRFAVQADTSSSAAGSDNNKTERGADGAAMSDDFYTRDVGAEYEEMDYDAAEQFDDDDVDVGETEMQNVGTDGYNEDEDDDDNDDDSEDMNDDDDDAIGGAEGLASMAGYKALLAKARGEIQATASTEKVDESRASSPTTVNSNATSGAGALSSTATSIKNGDEGNMKRSASPKPDKGKSSDDMKPTDHLAKKMAAAEKAVQALKNKQKQPTNSSSVATASSNGAMNNATAATPQVDEYGLRFITLDAVRKEIWLNHGSIPINRLIKIFNANKKHGEVRQNQLKEVIKELCTMTTDPIHGRVLVLKQHYSHMS